MTIVLRVYPWFCSLLLCQNACLWLGCDLHSQFLSSWWWVFWFPGFGHHSDRSMWVHRWKVSKFITETHSWAQRLCSGSTWVWHKGSSWSRVSWLIVAYTATSQYFENQSSLAFGIVKSSFGLGPMCTLFFLGFIFNYVGLFWTYTILGALTMILSPLNFLALTAIKPPTEASGDPQKINIWILFTNIKILICFFSVVMAMLIINGPSPLVSGKYEQFDVEEYVKGYLLLCTNVPFTVTSLLLHFVLKALSKRVLICIGYVVLTLACICFGPSEILRLPE